jgi:hypothetical protein
MRITINNIYIMETTTIIRLYVEKQHILCLKFNKNEITGKVRELFIFNYIKKCYIKIYKNKFTKLQELREYYKST